MDAKSVTLKLFLDELDVSNSITTVDDRKRVQKAVYLGQRAGVDLGYRFSWYLKGPYSPGLTEDYYALAASLHDGETDYEDRELVPHAKHCLGRIQPLMVVPSELKEALAQEDWLELVASTDYLLTVRKCDLGPAKDVLQQEKPRLAPYFGRAIESLKKYGLRP